MTARYARLRDETIRRHWERARKVNIAGETIILEAGTPLSDAAWMKENLGRATMALPNGYCGLPLQQTCPHANACLTCPVFITTPDGWRTASVSAPSVFPWRGRSPCLRRYACAAGRPRLCGQFWSVKANDTTDGSGFGGVDCRTDCSYDRRLRDPDAEGAGPSGL
jgi:hypothetical protein